MNQDTQVKVCAFCGNFIVGKPHYTIDDWAKNSPVCPPCWNEGVLEGDN